MIRRLRASVHIFQQKLKRPHKLGKRRRLQERNTMTRKRMKTMAKRRKNLMRRTKKKLILRNGRNNRRLTKKSKLNCMVTLEKAMNGTVIMTPKVTTSGAKKVSIGNSTTRKTDSPILEVSLSLARTCS